MLEKERQVLIMDKIRQDGFVLVKDLMTQLDTSRSSVMRDLIALEEKGLLVREHGGALLPGINEVLSKKSEPMTREKEGVHLKEKQLIANAAAERIQNGMTVFIDSGTTAACLAEFVVSKEITIVTPSVYLVRQLPRQYKCTVNLLGGTYDSQYDMNTGEYTMAMLEYHNFDAAFMSANGADPNSGDVMAADFALAVQKQFVMKRSSKNYLLIDASKLSQKASCVFANMKEFETVFVNETKHMHKRKNIVQVKEKK